MQDNLAELKRGELAQFSQEADWRKLPPIHNYWTSRYLGPKMRAVFEAATIPEFYARGMARGHDATRPLKVLSIGSGLCVQEQNVAVRLRDLGYDVHIDCFEMSPERVAQAEARFRREGVDGILSVTNQDLNEWRPSAAYDAVMANQCLHHFVELEILFDACLACLREGGRFLTNDVIGRNGHQRWPEVLKIVSSIWETMPRKYRYNHPYRRVDEAYDDHNYALKSFEGIRAQDIMPLLLQRFDATHFVAEGGIVDVFIDRKYGHNFSRDAAEDCAFIDRLGYMNDILIDAGVIKPTMVLGWFVKKGASPQPQRSYRHWTAEFCTRTPD